MYTKKIITGGGGGGGGEACRTNRSCICQTIIDIMHLRSQESCNGDSNTCIRIEALRLTGLLTCIYNKGIIRAGDREHCLLSGRDRLSLISSRPHFAIQGFAMYGRSFVLPAGHGA